MFEIMVGSRNIDPNGAVKLTTEFTVPEIATANWINNVGTTESGDLVFTPNAGTPNLVIYTKNASGKWVWKQSITNGKPVFSACYAIPYTGGFAIPTSGSPNGRGSLSIWKRQADGTYVESGVAKETGGTSGSLGGYGGIAAIDDWLFSAVNYSGSYLFGFKDDGGLWMPNSGLMRPGADYFAATCIRKLSDTELVASSTTATVNSLSNAGAAYIVTVDKTTGAMAIKQQVTATPPRANGDFSNSIAVINSNRFVVMSFNGTTATELTSFSRPDAASPFSVTHRETLSNVPKASTINMVYSHGMLFLGTVNTSGNAGETMIFSINDAGVITHLPAYTFKGVAGEWMARAQAVVGDQLFYVSAWRNDTSKNSVIKVYNIQSD